MKSFSAKHLKKIILMDVLNARHNFGTYSFGCGQSIWLPDISLNKVVVFSGFSVLTIYLPIPCAVFKTYRFIIFPSWNGPKIKQDFAKLAASVYYFGNASTRKKIVDLDVSDGFKILIIIVSFDFIHNCQHFQGGFFYIYFLKDFAAENPEEKEGPEAVNDTNYGLGDDSINHWQRGE